jgi:hypothetical protein
MNEKEKEKYYVVFSFTLIYADIKPAVCNTGMVYS